MKLKDLLGISLVSIFLFPIILVGIMLAAGVVHLEFGDGKDKDRIKTAYTGVDQAKQEEAEAKQLKSFKALETKEKELREKQAEVNVEIERLENLKLETMKAKDEIAGHRQKIEELVGKSEVAQDKQIASLAEVYGGMRPDEAAPILLSLDNAMVVRIMKKIPEMRATSKLLAALAALNVRRAAEITTLLGGKARSEKAKASSEDRAPKVEPASNKKDAAPDAAGDQPATDKAKGDKNGDDARTPKADDKTDTKKGAPGKA
jgi:flagellar motility protein MotE (MotC chaperone)